jgi:hypothetical protein
MSVAVQAGEPAEPDLIDRIANALPVEVRTEYYQELRHCRSLPSNDEMLRILRAMQFLTMLMVQVPERVATERERLEQLLADGMRILQTTLESSKAYQEQLDQRLERLPENIATRINPEAIAREINESLRQQFVRSTIPDTARALAVAAKQMQDVTAEFGRTATTLGNRYDGAAAQALRAIQDIQRISADAIATTRHGAQELLELFHQEYRWLVCAASSLGLLIGFGLGVSWYRWFAAPAPTVDSTPAVQTAPPAKPSTKH